MLRLPDAWVWDSWYLHDGDRHHAFYLKASRALLDPDRDLTKYAKVIPTGSNDVLSVEVKDPKRPEYGTITMVFVRDGAAPAGLRLRGWVALDSQNNRTRIDLSNQKFNVAVADSAFRWTDPRPNKRGR